MPTVDQLIMVLVYLTGYTVATFLGSPLVSKILKKIDANTESCSSSGLKGAGKLIGMLERILSVTFVYLNVPTAIAFIIAAKTIVRFESTKDRRFAEYFLVGTLSSVTFAVVTGIAFNYLAGLLPELIELLYNHLQL